MRFFLGIAAGLMLAAPSCAGWQDGRAAWNKPAEPFAILGNVYYVGTAGLSAFLVTGPQGHVLIDGGTPQAAPLIAANIEKLGFRLRDVKFLLINHSHYDHAGGLAELKRRTGAQLVASRGDAPDLAAGKTLARRDLTGFPAVRVDRLIGDGEQVRVGPVVLTALLTPGHTAGATSWTTIAGGKRVLFASSLSVAGERLAGTPSYPGVVRDFRASFAKLRGVQADVFLNFHAEGFDLAAKRKAQQAGKRDAFVDPGETRRRVDAAAKAFEGELREQGKK
ncbi:subclass B3 metallo-beta-lactamase [Sphingomonas sp. MMS12-HWE2-04]|uniref:subclass B3 metallo-beta-lactamase n=1 Tax=Sphingomonas sp. MMS12-HWE2-04 TaxID=3234199 RepID=UPI00385006CB